MYSPRQTQAKKYNFILIFANWGEWKEEHRRKLEDMAKAQRFQRILRRGDMCLTKYSIKTLKIKFNVKSH